MSQSTTILATYNVPLARERPSQHATQSDGGPVLCNEPQKTLCGLQFVPLLSYWYGGLQSCIGSGLWVLGFGR